MYGVRWSRADTSFNPDTIIIVCTGPSLKDFDFTKIKDKGYIIAVNDAVKYAPFSNAWFTLDPWGLTTGQIPKWFVGEKYAAVPEDYGTREARAEAHRVIPNARFNYLHRVIFHTVETTTHSDLLNWGLNEDPSCINTGNSGFGALNLAYHFNPKRIFLFGLDASRGYFFNENRSTRSLNHLPAMFKSALPQLNKKKIEVYNASPESKIDCFPRYTLEAAVKKLDSFIC